MKLRVPADNNMVYRSGLPCGRSLRVREFLLVALMFWVGSVCAADFVFDLDAVAKANGTILSRGAAGEWVMQPSAERRSIELPGVGAGVPWDRAGFLVLEVGHENVFTTRLVFEFLTRAGAEPEMTVGIATLPLLPTQVIFPLEELTKEHISLRPQGRQLTSQMRGRPLDRAAIVGVRVRLQPFQAPEALPKLTVRSVRLTDAPPPPEPAPEKPFVDAFGQWNRKDWPGKTSDENELRAALVALRERAAQGRWPENWSRFGGWKEKRFEATGYFRTQHDGRRWWLVDPEGCAFLSVGPSIITPSTVSRYAGLENLFAWLPEKDGKFGAMRDTGSINFLGVNLARAFGDKWNDAWEAMTTGLLREWRFNTLGNSSAERLMNRREVPYAFRLGMRQHRYPATERLIFRDFPDVFAPEFEANAKVYAQRLEPRKDDPWMIGYFMTNEPEWAFGKHNLALELIRKAPPFHAREALGTWLRERYRDDVSRFNASWGVRWESFDTAHTWVMPGAKPSPTQEADLWAFSMVMVKRFYAVPAAELRAVAPNHLNLGVRYAYVSSDLCYAGAEVFDVFSLNSYNMPGPVPTGEIATRTSKPVLIGEFHFGALDRGLPSVGLRGVATQEQRGFAYANYIGDAMGRPEIVGAHYFQWNDQTITGRSDGEHYNIGVMDVCHRPYEEFTRAFAPIHEAMYEIAEGTRKYRLQSVTAMPSINTNQ